MKINGLLALLSLFTISLVFSCTKVNESTELGDELIPSVDNVNTFDTTLEVQAAYFPFEDSSKHFINENMALGRINDPAFGTTTADMYFNLSSTVYGSSPFKENAVIDSVILQLSYRGAYGDTTTASQITAEVSEIQQNIEFRDDTIYRFDHPGFPTVTALGSKSFSIPQFRDSITFSPSGKRNESTKVANVLRIKLNNNSLGQRLATFDTTATGGFKNDSLFRAKFRGLAVKAINAASPGTLAYFNVNDVTNTALLVYYHSRNNGVEDTAVARFVHNVYSQANSIKRNPGGEYLAKIGQANSQKLYIQSSPSGSYVGMKIPGLTGFPNKVIHRAELIAYNVGPDNAAVNNFFTPPNRLLLDHKGENNSKDSAYIFENDIQPGLDGSLNFAAFGGTLRSDQSYRFNITRYVQGIVTRGERNDSLRLFAPLRTNMYAKSLRQMLSVPSLDAIAKGRVVIANNNFPDSSKRLRLRIIYSNL